jgi:DNA-binding Xre family transcriptional regulator
MLKGGKMKSIQQYQLKREEVLRLLGEQSLKRWWVAEMSGIHKTTLRRWLQGKTRTVRSVHLEQLARTLETSIQEIAQPVAVKKQ